MPFIQEGKLAQAFEQDIVIKVSDSQDRIVGPEGNFCSAFGRIRQQLSKHADWLSLEKFHFIDFAILIHLDIILLDRALTQETPTPCRPPETL